MNTGTVYAIGQNPDGSPSTTGRVLQDGTEMIYGFSDPNFPKTGLQVNSPCSFDLVPDPSDPSGLTTIATNLQTYTPAAPKNITGPYTGDITANAGDTYTITGNAAIVNGNIIINGGIVYVEQNAQVIGKSHQVGAGGTFVVRKGGTAMGGVVVATGGNLRVVNNGIVNGSLSTSNAGVIIVGNNNGPGAINGSLNLNGVRSLKVNSNSTLGCK